MAKLKISWWNWSSEKAAPGWRAQDYPEREKVYCFGFWEEPGQIM